MVRGGGLVATSYVYGLFVILLAVVATFHLIRIRTHNATTDQPRRSPDD